MVDKQLPEGWQMVKFGDIANNISKRVEPNETDLKIYVGLEHLDPDSLRIKRHGVPSDVDGQKLLVKKGQIIFGKRRAYQRKVAVAEWDCICSAHAMVLEANTDKVLPEFLPFFMQSDVFMKRAVAVSEGSLSPTIKWKALESQVFSIPSRKEQVKLVHLYQLIKENIEKSQKTLRAIESLKKSIVLKFREGGYSNAKLKKTVLGMLPADWEVKTLDSIFNNLDNRRIPIKSSDRKEIMGHIPYYGASGIIDYVNKAIFDEPLMLFSEDGANLVERNTPIAL